MTNSSPEPIDLSDPSISPYRLQELAQTHPEQWDEILAHPNVYPGLADWIRDRQSELAATGDDVPQEDATTDAQTNVDAAARTEAGQGFASEESPVEETSAEQESQPDEHFDATTQQSGPGESAAQTDWAMPDAAPHGQQSGGTPRTESGSTAWDAQSQQPGPQAEQHPTEQQLGAQLPGSRVVGQYQHPHETSQQQAGASQYGYGQAHQSGQQYGQPQQFAARREASRIDLSSTRTWGLFVAGGAAFLSLFGFLFSPTLEYAGPFDTHLGSGGWVVLLLLIATVALSLLQLLKPSRWMRFFFIAVSMGAAFMTLGRTLTLIGYFSMRYTSFSTLWLLFMALVILAGALMFLAPKASDSNMAHATRATPGQQQQFGATPPYGYQPQPGQQPGGYPQYPAGPRQDGGYSSGGPQQDGPQQQ